MRRAHAALYSILTASLAAHAFAGPPGDYGDAPVGNNGQGINAYPGVVARWDTLYNHTNTVFSPQWPQGAWLNTGGNSYLGQIPPITRNDSTLDPALPENDCAPVILIYTSPPNPGINPLAEIEVTVTTTAGHNGQDPVYLNIWIDQNRDGQWKDGYYLGTPLIAWNLEWAVQDVPVLLPANTTARVNTQGIRLENPTASVWIRVMVSDEPVGAAFRGPVGTVSHFWDSTMIAAHNFHGEIEDHLLNWNPGVPPSATPIPGVYYRQIYNAPGPPPRPKPACDLFYKGPWRVFPPKCPAMLNFPLNYTFSERNGGCGLAPALWGMYGLKHIAGFPAPPIVVLGAPIPLGAAVGAVGMACPPPGGAPALAPAIPGEGPLMASMTVPVASITGPGRIFLDTCYGWPPKRWRVYRAFFHHFTCGSIHAGRTVHEYPETGVTVASTVEDGPGYSADYCDFEIGGLEETFEDPSAGRPFPDPDFTQYVFHLPSPTGSQAQLDPDVFNTPPHSLRLRRAGYEVRPTFPQDREAVQIELVHLGLVSVTLTSVNGETMASTLPGSADWETVTIDIPDNFRLDSLRIDAQLAAHVDDIFIDLRPSLPPPPRPCDPDVNCDGSINGFDIEATEQAVNGDFSNFCQESADLNGDGAENGFDIETEEQRVNGAPC